MATSGWTVAKTEPYVEKAAPQDEWAVAKTEPYQEPSNAGILESTGAGIFGGLSKQLAKTVATGASLVGAKDTAEYFDKQAEELQKWEDKHGGKSFIGEVASGVGSFVPSIAASVLSGGATAVPTIINLATQVAPGVRDTYNQQIAAGASVPTAVTHALTEGGLMLVGGRLINSAGKTVTTAANKVLPKAVQVGEGIGAQSGAAALEGAAFTGTDIAAHTAIDAAAGRTTPDQSGWDVARQIAVGAATFGAGRAAHMAGDKLMAPKTAATTTPPVTPPAGTTPPATPPAGKNTTADSLVAKGVPASVAARMAAKQNAATTTPAATPAATPAGPTAEQTMVAKWPDAMLTGTLDFQLKKASPNLAIVDAIKDELKKRAQVEPEGTENAGQTKPQPSGESASVASGAPAVEPTGGPATPARAGVVPAEPNVGVPAAGEVSAPAPVEETKSLNLSFPHQKKEPQQMALKPLKPSKQKRKDKKHQQPEQQT